MLEVECVGRIGSYCSKHVIWSDNRWLTVITQSRKIDGLSSSIIDFLGEGCCLWVSYSINGPYSKLVIVPSEVYGRLHDLIDPCEIYVSRIYFNCHPMFSPSCNINNLIEMKLDISIVKWNILHIYMDMQKTTWSDQWWNTEYTIIKLHMQYFIHIWVLYNLWSGLTVEICIFTFIVHIKSLRM